MENRNNSFRRKHFSVIDRLLIQVATCAVILLVLVQALLVNGETRKYLSLVDKLEGEQLPAPTARYAADISRLIPNNAETAVDKVIARSKQVLRSGQDITIRMITPSASMDCLVTINGEIAGNFSRGKLELTVYDGDYLEIDATRLAKPAQFIIDTRKSSLLSPVDGLMLQSHSSIIAVGKIMFNH